LKDFLNLTFDPRQCRQEVLALRTLLDSQPELEENRVLKPFFEAHHQLTLFLGSFSPEMDQFDLVAFQYSLFGDFSCDIVVGDSQRQAYSFIELEEATATSIFHRQGRKATPEWSTCFEHGLSQLTDWFWKLDDMSITDDFAARFGRRRAPYFGLLVVGRDNALAAVREQQRWEWRRRKVIVNSQTIYHVTYDELCDNLLSRLDARYPPPDQTT
jgi:Domain of unknown function (DUF4263)